MLTDLAPSMAIALAATPTDPAQRRNLLTGEVPSLGAPLLRDIAIRGATTGAGALTAGEIGRLTGTRRRAATIALAALVGTQLGQTLLIGARNPLVLATGLGSAALLAGLIQTPGSASSSTAPPGPPGLDHRPRQLHRRYPARRGRPPPAANPRRVTAAHRPDDQGARMTATSTTKSAKNHGSNQQATRQAVDANRSHLRFHLGDTEVDVNLPPLNKLAFYAGLSAVPCSGSSRGPSPSSPASSTCFPMTATTAPCKPSAKLSTPPDPGQNRRPNNHHHPASAGNADNPAARHDERGQRACTSKGNGPVATTVSPTVPEPPQRQELQDLLQHRAHLRPTGETDATRVG